jgi:mannose-6-phosphate isomerase-like protein (cupin superfamily)
MLGKGSIPTGGNMLLNRRELCLLLPAAAIPMLDENEAIAADNQVLASATFSFDKLAVQISNNAEIRPILKGKLATGESLEVHETTLQPGGAPHPAHHHEHSEMWLIREGTVELTIAGVSSRIGPGGLGFVRSNEEHGIKNVGSTTATYFVVAIGPEADR